MKLCPVAPKLIMKTKDWDAAPKGGKSLDTKADSIKANCRKKVPEIHRRYTEDTQKCDTLGTQACSDLIQTIHYDVFKFNGGRKRYRYFSPNLGSNGIRDAKNQYPTIGNIAAVQTIWPRLFLGEFFLVLPLHLDLSQVDFILARSSKPNISTR